MENDKRENMISLYDIYQNLLTLKQREYFEEYYYSDLSITEIALNNSVSRNAIFDQLKKVENILLDYENNLKLKEKFDSILKYTNNDEEIIKIIKE